MGSAKRTRQRANKQAGIEAAQPIPELTDADFEALLVVTTVRADCEHASTRDTDDGLVLMRCLVAADVGGGCPTGCVRFEGRRIGGLGTGT